MTPLRRLLAEPHSPHNRRPRLVNYLVWCTTDWPNPRGEYIDHTNARDAAACYAAGRRWKPSPKERVVLTNRDGREREWVVVVVGVRRFTIHERRGRRHPAPGRAK